MNKRRVAILLNPPAKDIAIRDNYCSKISQAAYVNHPVDLLFQSGYLANTHQVELVDAVADGLTVNTCLDRIIKLDPAVVFTLTGNATWQHDLAFFKLIRHSLPDVRIVCSGDILLESPVEFLKQNIDIDAVLTDFTSDGMIRYLTNDFQSCENMVYRADDGTIMDRRVPRQQSGILEAPVPLHELFINHDYRYPFVRSRRFATVMTEFGCPFNCSFCIMGTLGCKRRPVPDVLRELHYLQQLNVRDVFFLDQSFGSDRERNLELCREIHQNLPGLRWLCFSRVDLVDATILSGMKRAGCHTIIFGVETADESLLSRYRKGYTPDDVRRVLMLAKKSGIRTVATFLLGLPGETWESAIRTIDFACSLPCTYASLNVAVPRMGTEMRAYALSKGYVDPNLQHFDQSGSEVVMNTETLSREQLGALKHIAVRRLYLNPRRVIRMLSSIRTADEFLIQFRDGLELIRRFLRKTT